MAYRCVTSVVVRSYELDSYGHVNNAVYMQWLEHGRSRLLQDKGFSYNNIEAHWGVRFVLVSTRIDYHVGLLLADQVEVTTEVIRIGRTSVTFDQKILRLAPDPTAEPVVAASCESTIVFTDPGMSSPVPVPQPFRDLYG